MPRKKYFWTSLSDDELLNVRIKDLKVTVEGTWLARCLHTLYAELDEHDIRVRPHAWISSEWFSPENTPGIAIPFYLAHPRLEKLERRIMREAEGGNSRWFMRILRHEAGHALDNAYRRGDEPMKQLLLSRGAQLKPWTVTLKERIVIDAELIDEICLENEQSLKHMK